MMKVLLKYGLLLLVIVFTRSEAWACTVCEKQQPEITQGLTHGAGPQSNWDWVIIALVTAITILTLVLSVKYLVRPRESSPDHIKKSILTP